MEDLQEDTTMPFWWTGLTMDQVAGPEGAYTKFLDTAKGKQDELRELNRWLCQTDLYYLLAYGCGRRDMRTQWCFDRAREVQSAPDGRLDLWAREHYKSSIITFGMSLLDVLNDSSITICILSYNRPTARAFLRHLKAEFETNTFLQGLFPEIFYTDPRKQSSKWSEDDGLILRRRGNPREATVEAYGLVDSMPTGRHYSHIIWDDVVTRESVTTPEMIGKVTECWELSLNLTSVGCRQRMVGTRYHFNDTYAAVLERGTMIPRIYPATVDGRADGDPVMWSRETLNQKRRDMGVYVFSCQLLLDPKQATEEGFREEWLRYWSIAGWEKMNRYVTVDPSSAKRKTSDYTAMIVWGLGDDGNYYIIDMIRDRLNLTERTRKFLDLCWKYRPILAAGYEQYGLQADIEHIEGEMAKTNRRFVIKPLGGSLSKVDRIKRMIPKFELGKIYLPYSLPYIDYEGRSSDLVKRFVADEYLGFPVSQYDDVLDAMARILDEDLHAQFPLESRNYGTGRATDQEIRDAYAGEDESILGFGRGPGRPQDGEMYDERDPRY